MPTCKLCASAEKSAFESKNPIFQTGKSIIKNKTDMG